MKKDKLSVGEIVKPQGVKGQVKVVTYSGDNERFKSYKRIFLDDIEYKIVSVGLLTDAVILSLDGITDRNAAESLRGKVVDILRSEAPPLTDDEFYVVDLIGLDVIVDDIKIGTLIDINNFGASDIYTIELEGGKTVQVPAVDKVVTSVSVDEGVIILDKQGYEETVVD